MFRRRIPTAVKALAICAFISTPSYAADIDIPFTKFTLENGLDVIVHEDHSSPTVTLMVFYHVGSKDEVPGKTGFAHLFEHLMFEGSENSGGAFADVLKRYGSVFMNGATTNDFTFYFETMPTPSLDAALWLESDRMGHLLGAINQTRLDEQRGVVQNEKRQREGTPYGRDFGLIAEHTYPQGHPYSWSVIGSMADLNAASLDDVRDWFRKYYGPNNVTLVLVGDVTAEVAREKVQEYFGSFAPNPPVLRTVDKPAIGSAKGRVRFESQVPNDRVTLVWNTPDRTSDDAIHLEVLMDMLGGSRSSRLNRQLIDEEQLATETMAFYFGRELGGQVYFTLTAKEGVSTSQLEERALAVLDDIISRGVTKAELERTKTRLRSFFLTSLENQTSKALTLGTDNLVYGDPGYFQTRLAAIENTTPKDVQDVARLWLSDEPFVLETVKAPDVTASGSDVDRSRIPEPDGQIDLDLPRVSEMTLSNGLKVRFMDKPGLPLFRASLVFDSGAVDDPAGKFGLAHLAFNMLDEGAGKRGAREISEAFDSLGLQWSVNTNLEFSDLNIYGPVDAFGGAFSIVADILMRPRFDADDIARVKALQINAILAEKASQSGAAWRMMEGLLFGAGHPYSRPTKGLGYTDDINTIGRDELIEFHRAHARPDNATLLLVGDFSSIDFKASLEEALGQWRAPSGGRLSRSVPGAAEQLASSRVYLIDRPGAQQSVINLAFTVGSLSQAEETALDVANKVLGGGFVSRLNSNIREEKGWSYGVRSSVEQRTAQHFMTVWTNVQTDKTVDAMLEIRREMREMKRVRPITEEEFNAEKTNIVSSMGGRYGNTQQLMFVLQDTVRRERTAEFPEQYLAGIRTLDLASVQAATDVITPDALVWLISGDREVVEQQLRDADFGPVEILELKE